MQFARDLHNMSIMAEVDLQFIRSYFRPRASLPRVLKKCKKKNRQNIIPHKQLANLTSTSSLLRGNFLRSTLFGYMRYEIQAIEYTIEYTSRSRINITLLWTFDLHYLPAKGPTARTTSKVNSKALRLFTVTSFRLTKHVNTCLSNI